MPTIYTPQNGGVGSPELGSPGFQEPVNLLADCPSGFIAKCQCLMSFFAQRHLEVNGYEKDPGIVGADR
jgi:hypothetical protein